MLSACKVLIGCLSQIGQCIIRGVDPYFGLGGGGGGGGTRVYKKNFKFFGALRAQIRNINIKNSVCSVAFSVLNLMVLQCLTVLFKPILAWHIMNFSSCRNYWRGGGQNDMFTTPIFSWGRLPPPPLPPRIDATVYYG